MKTGKSLLLPAKIKQQRPDIPPETTKKKKKLNKLWETMTFKLQTSAVQGTDQQERGN